MIWPSFFRVTPPLQLCDARVCGRPAIPPILRYPRGMSTKEKVRTLVDQLPTDKTERALKFLRRLLQAQPDNDEVLVSGQDDPMRQLIA